MPRRQDVTGSHLSAGGQSVGGVLVRLRAEERRKNTCWQQAALTPLARSVAMAYTDATIPDVVRVHVGVDWGVLSMCVHVLDHSGFLVCVYAR